MRLGLGNLFNLGEETDKVINGYTRFKVKDDFGAFEEYVPNGYEIGISIKNKKYPLVHFWNKDAGEISQVDIEFIKKGRKHYLAMTCMVEYHHDNIVDEYLVYYVFDNNMQFVERFCEDFGQVSASVEYNGVDECFDPTDIDLSDESPVLYE